LPTAGRAPIGFARLVESGVRHTEVRASIDRLLREKRGNGPPGSRMAATPATSQPLAQRSRRPTRLASTMTPALVHVQ
jgi:hypothetical protein